MLRLVQIWNGSSRRVALVEEPNLRILSGYDSVYELTVECVRMARSLSAVVAEVANGELLSYDAVYSGGSNWRLLAPIDIPGGPERMLISGTGLTHLGSAKDRQAMHEQGAVEGVDAAKPLTDSMRMFQWGVAGGKPREGEIGTSPEWFYKGTGSIVQAPFEPLSVPSHGQDGGEEAEIAGVYLIGDDGAPYRIGMCASNEFSDHKLEQVNYLYLAGSKLRQCSLGPELVVDGNFHSVTGDVRVERGDNVVWQRSIETGEATMSHSLANMEHHHFKFDAHRIPGHVHVHFFGAHSLSFGEGVELQDGDWMQVHFAGYGRALRNPIRFESKSLNQLVRVTALS